MEFRTLKEEILNISSQYGITLRKNQGQCFLINEQVADFIIRYGALDADRDVVLEIGPGFGCLTQKIIQNAKETIVIENDRKLSKYLREKFVHNENISIITQDAIKTTFPKHSKLISNVPYQISGPLIQKIVESKEKADIIILMLQEEFIRRMQSLPQAKGYGRLSVIAQLLFQIEDLKRVSPYDFYPQPQIESGIVKLTFNPEYVNNPYLGHFMEFLAGIFPFKNKILPKALSFLKKNIDNFPKLQFLRNLDIDSCVGTDMKNKRLFQLLPREIWNFFKKIQIKNT
ncbi:MAG: ribosomal RNA small subunit methyltransferase A [Candidatus Lokiarchaeota archaeon]|nr:ribosomal RNA small subunit methyltransferase A [Candidatus Lokiarchaeota archaeon]